VGSSIDEQIKKMWYMYTQYYSAIKRNQTLSFAVTWMKLEGIILCEKSQVQKDKYHMFSVMWKLKKVDLHLRLRMQLSKKHIRPWV
jgi:hypothetical protein